MKDYSDLYDYSGEDAVIPSGELLEIEKVKWQDFPKYRTFFHGYEDFIGATIPGELNIFSGTTGGGKTTLLKSMSMDYASQGINVLWFSFEMTNYSFLQDFSEESLEHIFMPKLIPTKQLDWLEDRIIEAQAKYGVKAIFVDHLHYLLDLGKIGHPSLEIGGLMRNLKLLTTNLNIITYLIAHPMKVKADTELGTGDVRDSSFIEQEADNVAYLFRLKGSVNKTILKVTKARKTYGACEFHPNNKFELEFRNRRYYEASKDV